MKIRWCPNISSKEWQTLLKEIGEVKAYIVWHRNGGDIPTLEKAKEIIEKARASYGKPTEKVLESAPKPEAISLTQAVERMGAKEKAREVHEEEVELRKEIRAEAREKVAEVKESAYEKGKAKGEELSIEDTIDRSLSKGAELAGIKSTKGKFNWMADVGGELEGLAKDIAVMPQDKKDETIRNAIRVLFGSEQYLPLRRVSKGSPEKTLFLLRDHIGRLLIKKYGKQVERMLKIKPGKLFVSAEKNYKKVWADLVSSMPKTKKERLAAGWQKQREWFEGLRKVITDSRSEQMMFLERKRVNLEQVANRSTEEITAWIDPISDKIERAPSFVRNVAVDQHASMYELALMFGNGEESSQNKKLFYNDLAQSESSRNLAQWNIRNKFDSFLQSLGVDDNAKINMMTESRKIDLTPLDSAELTSAQVINILALSLRPDAKLKMSQSGIVKEEQKGGGPGTIKAIDLDMVKGQASDMEKEIAGKMVKLLTEMGKKANKTSMAIDGFERFGESNYFPIRTDRTILQRETKQDIGDLNKFYKTMLEDLGFTKETVRHKLPLVIGNAFAVFDDHVSSMASYTHLTIPIRNVLQIMGHPDFGAAMRTRYGTQMEPRIRDMLGRLAGLYSYTTDHPAWLRGVEALSRNAAISILALRASTYVFNRVGGSILFWSELMHIDPEIAGEYAIASAVPQALWGENKRIADLLLLDGYLENRWTNDLTQVFVHIPRDSRSIETKGWLLKWKKIQNSALRPFANAETRNGITLFKVLKRHGFSDSAAVKLISDLTRRTQNPASVLDESGFLQGIKRSGVSTFTPFMGQPTVMANLALRDGIKVRAAIRNKKDIGKAIQGLLFTLVGLLASILFEEFVRRQIYEVSGKGKKKTREEKDINSLFNLTTGLMDVLIPGTGNLADYVREFADRGYVNPRSLHARTLSDIGGGLVGMATGKEDFSGNFLKFFVGISRFIGAPTGGAEQLGGIVKGIVTGTSYDSALDVPDEVIARATYSVHADPDDPESFGQPVKGRALQYKDILARWKEMTGKDEIALANEIVKYRQGKRIEKAKKKDQE